jgi:hypothetical protein
VPGEMVSVSVNYDCCNDTGIDNCVVHTIYEKERQKTHEVKNIYNIKKKAGLQFSFLEYISTLYK